MITSSHNLKNSDRCPVINVAFKSLPFEPNIRISCRHSPIYAPQASTMTSKSRAQHWTFGVYILITTPPPILRLKQAAVLEYNHLLIAGDSVKVTNGLFAPI